MPKKNTTLTHEDWTEIYYALDYKLSSPAVDGAPRWTSHLKSIMEKIGPDGDDAFAAARASATSPKSATLGPLPPPPTHPAPLPPKTYSYIADARWNGTVEREIAIVLDNELIGPTVYASGTMDALVDKLVAAFYRHQHERTTL
jgi:hypothetical protein